jgi:hypothetical protein
MAPDHDAEWITSAAWKAEPDGPLPVLAAVMPVVGPPRSAFLRIAGVGVFVATVNGEVVSDPLEPGYSDFAQRVEFGTYDLTPLLKPGDNVITVELGPGCYRSTSIDGRWAKITTNYGDLATCATVDWIDADGPHTIHTDTAWHGTTGPVTRSNWVGGEDYDATLSLDLEAVATWPRAVPAQVPPGMRLSPKTIHPSGSWNASPPSTSGRSSPASTSSTSVSTSPAGSNSTYRPGWTSGFGPPNFSMATATSTP